MALPKTEDGPPKPRRSSVDAAFSDPRRIHVRIGRFRRRAGRLLAEHPSIQRRIVVRPLIYRTQSERRKFGQLPVQTVAFSHHAREGLKQWPVGSPLAMPWCLGSLQEVLFSKKRARGAVENRTPRGVSDYSAFTPKEQKPRSRTYLKFVHSTLWQSLQSAFEGLCSAWQVVHSSVLP